MGRYDFSLGEDDFWSLDVEEFAALWRRREFELGAMERATCIGIAAFINANLREGADQVDPMDLRAFPGAGRPKKPAGPNEAALDASFAWLAAKAQAQAQKK